MDDNEKKSLKKDVYFILKLIYFSIVSIICSIIIKFIFENWLLSIINDNLNHLKSIFEQSSTFIIIIQCFASLIFYLLCFALVFFVGGLTCLMLIPGSIELFFEKSHDCLKNHIGFIKITSKIIFVIVFIDEIYKIFFTSYWETNYYYYNDILLLHICLVITFIALAVGMYYILKFAWKWGEGFLEK